MIYYGNEVGVTGHNDPDDRRTFPWKDLNKSGESTHDPLDFGQGGDFELYKLSVALSKLRKENPILMHAKRPLFVHADDNAKTVAYLLHGESEVVLVVLNRDSSLERPVRIELPIGLLPTRTEWKQIFHLHSQQHQVGSSTETFVGRDNVFTLSLQSLDAKVFRLTNRLVYPKQVKQVTVQVQEANKTHINWTTLKDAAIKYHVLRSEIPGGHEDLIGTVQAELTFRNVKYDSSYDYTDNTGNVGQVYYYKVVALDADGLMSQVNLQVESSFMY